MYDQSPSGTSTPSTPSRTNSDTPPTFTATTGISIAIASANAIPKPSRSAAETTTSIPERYEGTSCTYPQNTTFRPSPRFSASASKCRRRVPSPRMYTCIFGTRRATRAATSSTTSCLLSSASLPTTASLNSACSSGRAIPTRAARNLFVSTPGWTVSALSSGTLRHLTIWSRRKSEVPITRSAYLALHRSAPRYTPLRTPHRPVRIGLV